MRHEAHLTAGNMVMTEAPTVQMMMAALSIYAGFF